MASETFLKLSKLTKHMFVTTNEREKEPYINEMIRNLPTNLQDLEAHQKLMVYEGLG
jgi:exportin-1